MISINYFKVNFKEDSVLWNNSLLILIKDDDDEFILNRNIDRQKTLTFDVLEKFYKNILVKEYLWEEKEVESIMNGFEILKEKIGDKILISNKILIIPKLDFKFNLTENRELNKIFKSSKISQSERDVLTVLMNKKEINSIEFNEMIDIEYCDEEKNSVKMRKLKKDVKDKLFKHIEEINTEIKNRIGFKKLFRIEKGNKRKWEIKIDEKVY